MDNVILETIKVLGSLLLTVSAIAALVIQYVKESFKISDKSAGILSLIVGLVLSALVAWVYAADAGYHLELGQWVGVGLFVVVGTIGPSGGYKLLGALSGAREVK